MGHGDRQAVTEVGARGSTAPRRLLCVRGYLPDRTTHTCPEVHASSAQAERDHTEELLQQQFFKDVFKGKPLTLSWAQWKQIKITAKVLARRIATFRWEQPRLQARRPWHSAQSVWEGAGGRRADSGPNSAREGALRPRQDLTGKERLEPMRSRGVQENLPKSHTPSLTSSSPSELLCHTPVNTFQ